MINIAICEDLDLDCVTLNFLLQKYFQDLERDYSVEVFSSGIGFLATIEDFQWDIVFMDISLGDISGIDITRRVNETLPNCQIIYQTVSLEFFRDVYTTEHTYFLLKPVKFEDFKLAMDKSLKNISCGYLILEDRVKSRILFSDIIMIESLGHSMLFHTKSGEQIAVRNTFTQLIPTLSDSFARCHKSYVVNIDYIDKYELKKECQLAVLGRCIPIGRKFCEEFDIKVNKYWGKKIL